MKLALWEHFRRLLGAHRAALALEAEFSPKCSKTILCLDTLWPIQQLLFLTKPMLIP